MCLESPLGILTRSLSLLYSFTLETCFFSFVNLNAALDSGSWRNMIFLLKGVLWQILNYAQLPNGANLLVVVQAYLQCVVFYEI